MRPWYIISLAGIAAAIIALGITQLGTSTSRAARTSKETVAAANGVVQSTVSGSGEVEPGVDDTLNFGTSGTLRTLNVSVGEHVKKGQLIATLDPSSAELTLKEAEADLTAAKENLTEVEDGESTGSSSSGDSSSSGSSNDSAAATVADVTNDEETEFTSYERDADSDTTTTSPTTTGTTTTGTTTTATTTTGTTTVATTTSTPSVTKPDTTTTRSTTTRHETTTPTKSKSFATRTTTTSTKTSTAAKESSSAANGTANHAGSDTSSAGDKTEDKTGDSSTGSTANSSTGSTANSANDATTTTASKPTESEIEQAKVQVDEARATVNTDKKALADTKLYAPAGGTIAALSDTSIGESVSSGSDSSEAASASDSSSTDSSGTTGSSSSSGFAELINDNTMTMTVSLSEDDISSVKVGQIATVSITALGDVELAGHVSSISPLGSDSDGVVSYDATITVTQSNSKVLPGMSATASIVTQQAQGVTIPSDAISGSGSSATVQLVKSDGSVVTQPVVVGLKGTSRSQIVSGLKAGDEVQITITLPSLGSSGTSTTSTTSATSGFGSGGFTGGTGGGFRALFSGGGGAP